MDPVIIAAAITATATGGATVVAAIVIASARYLISLVELGPKAQNGALESMLTMMEEMKGHNRREHKAFLHALEELTDVLAPRRPAGHQ
jgi:hypothetical protein